VRAFKRRLWGLCVDGRYYLVRRLTSFENYDWTYHFRFYVCLGVVYN
jgi:hypothetical protein